MGSGLTRRRPTAEELAIANAQLDEAATKSNMMLERAIERQKSKYEKTLTNFDDAVSEVRDAERDAAHATEEAAVAVYRLESSR